MNYQQDKFLELKKNFTAQDDVININWTKPYEGKDRTETMIERAAKARCLRGVLK
jgi:hypothetical protein